MDVQNLKKEIEKLYETKILFENELKSLYDTLDEYVKEDKPYSDVVNIQNKITENKDKLDKSIHNIKYYKKELNKKMEILSKTKNSVTVGFLKGVLSKYDDNTPLCVVDEDECMAVNWYCVCTGIKEHNIENTLYLEFKSGEIFKKSY